jgi:hypothetical protein
MHEGRLTIPDHVLARELEGECVLLNLQTEQYFGLDSVGTAMWTALTATPSIAAAREQLLSRFDVDEQRLRDDVDAFIDRLVSHGLAEVARE